MQFQVLASDYDGTLACDGHVDETTVAAIRRLKDSGRKFVLVTGRCLEPLIEIFPELDLCDLVVAENGALLYNPQTREERKLAEPPPPTFLARLAERGLPQLEIGRVIIATWTPHEHTVLETIREQALELQIIFNKGSVMILPSNVNKSTGLQSALNELSLELAHAVSIGDAENDETMLRMCGVGAAVDNALEAVKKRADLVTKGARGAGVTEVIDQLLADDLTAFHQAIEKRAQPPVATSPPQQDATKWEEKPTAKVEPRSEGDDGRSAVHSGELEPSQQFFFRGPLGKLNLAAKNLQSFSELAAGLDDETWQFHLERGDYANWFRDVLHDDELASTAADLQQNGSMPPQESRRQIVERIGRRRAS